MFNKSFSEGKTIYEYRGLLWNIQSNNNANASTFTFLERLLIIDNNYFLDNLLRRLDAKNILIICPNKTHIIYYLWNRKACSRKKEKCKRT